MRPLGIPTMKDRARHALHLLALDPVVEATADHNSYGFRQQRSGADAIEQCFKTLSKPNPQWILEGDIKSYQTSIENVTIRRFANRAMEAPQEMVTAHAHFFCQCSNGKRFSEPPLNDPERRGHPSFIFTIHFEIATAAGAAAQSPSSCRSSPPSESWKISESWDNTCDQFAIKNLRAVVVVLLVTIRCRRCFNTRFFRRTSNHEANHRVTDYGGLGTMHIGICR